MIKFLVNNDYIPLIINNQNPDLVYKSLFDKYIVFIL